MNGGAFNVQRVATGLLAALDIKEGRTPSYLASEYRATVEVLELLLQDSAITNASVATPAAGYAASGLVVPAGEIWIVTNFTGRVTCQALETVAGAMVAYERQLNLGNPFAGSGIYTACPAATSILVGGPVGTQPIFLRQGDTIGLYCFGVVGAPTGAAQVDYYRMRV